MEFKLNTMSEKEIKTIYKHAINTLYNVINKSYGPLASQTVMLKDGRTTFTKDGISIIDGLSSDNSDYNTVLSIFKGISMNVNKVVGDGTTTSIILLKHIIDEIDDYFSSEKKYITDLEINEVRKFIDKIADKIVSSSTEVKTVDEILNIAKVSLNHNEYLMDIIKSVYSEDKHINRQVTVTIGEKNNVVTNEHGMTIVDGSVVDAIFFNKGEDKMCEFTTKENEEIRVIFLDSNFKDYELESNFLQHLANDIQKLIQTKGVANIPKTIIMSSVPTESIYRFFADTIRQHQIFGKFVVLQNDKFSNEKMEDLATYLGVPLLKVHNNSDIMDEKYMKKYFEKDIYTSNIKSFVGTKGGFSFNVYDDAKHNKRFEDLLTRKKELESSLSDSDLVKVNEDKAKVIRLRLNALKGDLCSITVSAATSEEMSSNYKALEDCVNAIEKAKATGYNLGQNLLVPKIIDEMEAEDKNFNSELGIKLINAYKKALMDILKNKNHEEISEIFSKRECFNPIIDDYDNTIINPTKLDLEVLKTISEGIRIFFGTNQGISSIRTKLISLN